MSRKINWTPEMDKFIRDNCRDKTDAEIGRILGCKTRTINKRRLQLGIVKYEHSHYVQTEDFHELESYNLRLKKLKQSIKIDDQVEIIDSSIRKVAEKYPNFVVCMVNGFRESVLYIDIKRIIKNPV